MQMSESGIDCSSSGSTNTTLLLSFKNFLAPSIGVLYEAIMNRLKSNGLHKNERDFRKIKLSFIEKETRENDGFSLGQEKSIGRTEVFGTSAKLKEDTWTSRRIYRNTHTHTQTVHKEK